MRKHTGVSVESVRPRLQSEAEGIGRADRLRPEAPGVPGRDVSSVLQNAGSPLQPEGVANGASDQPVLGFNL